MLIIGDVHGKIDEYENIIYNANLQDKQTIQIGDFGFKREHDWHLNNINSNKHKILFGNHDYYPYLKCEHSLGNHKIINYENFNILLIRGAYSIDWIWRTVGVSWFYEEELSVSEFNEVFDALDNKIDIIISHEGPHSFINDKFGYESNKTSKIFDIILDAYNPKLWILGHHHVSYKNKFKNTEFIILDELEVLDLSNVINDLKK